mmetsp:Transcript_6755/g.26293  ORF Transcript_6755/g.26293 Transcript_6755/m.26293 type:complete len:309 (-) Transcript_6755:356-1282(-)
MPSLHRHPIRRHRHPLHVGHDPLQLAVLVLTRALHRPVKRVHVTHHHVPRVLGVAAAAQRLKRRHRDVLHSKRRVQRLERHHHAAGDAVRRLDQAVAVALEARTRGLVHRVLEHLRVGLRDGERIGRVEPGVGRDGEDLDARRRQPVLNLTVLRGDEGERGAALAALDDVLHAAHPGGHELRGEIHRLPQVGAVVLGESLFFFFKHRAERFADGGRRSDDGAEPERGVAEEVERQGSTHVPGAADDGEGLPVVDALAAGGGGDLGLAHGFVGEDGEGERGVRVVISARVADCARVEPTLGPRLENPSL